MLPKAKSSDGMHPTRHSAALIFYGSSGRVMPGVRRQVERYCTRLQMDIQVTDHCMILGGHSLRYSAYYFDVDKYTTLSSGETLKEILVQWANALTNLGNGQIIFLPFSLDDEWVECLKVTQLDEKLAYQYVMVSENGWALDVSDLSEFMASTHQVRKVTPEIAGECEKSEFISALLKAKVSTA